MKNLKKKRGFTVVELVIVIAVIGVLSAILIPTFSSLIGESKAKALQLSLRNSYSAYAGAEVQESDFVAESAARLSTKSTEHLAQGDEVWALNSSTGAWVKSTVADAEEGAKYTLVSNEPYNGYSVYSYTA